MTDNWSALDEWKMTPFENVPENRDYKFVCADEQFVAAGETFKFAAKSWADLNLGGNGATPLNYYLGTDIELVSGGDPANGTMDEEWNGVCYLRIAEDLKSGVVFFSNDKDELPEWLSAVENIEIDNNGVAEYFNLQGVRVAQPENGLYIVVKDGKATKAIF